MQFSLMCSSHVFHVIQKLLAPLLGPHGMRNLCNDYVLKIESKMICQFNFSSYFSKELKKDPCVYYRATSTQIVNAQCIQPFVYLHLFGILTKSLSGELMNSECFNFLQLLIPFHGKRYIYHY